ncbi:MAG: ubiquinol-cytochrome c reductase iron-sulfur subunit [Gemmatimonadaceae bacterium]
MSETNEPSSSTAACEGCALVARRDFLRDTALAAAGALIALGVAPGAARAAPIEFISALGGSREDKAYPIPAADGAQIDKANDAIITRWQGKVYVYSLACPHQNTVLKWSDSDKQFECPKHHSRFTPDGIYIKDSGRATRGMDRLAVRKDGNNVVANLDKLFQEDEDEAAWNAAFITV